MALRPWGPPPRLWPHVLDVSGNGHGAGVVHILRRRRGPSSRGWARSRRVGGDSAAAAGATTATRRGDRRGRCRGRGASADRKRVVSGKRVSLLVYLGCRRFLKNI